MDAADPVVGIDPVARAVLLDGAESIRTKTIVLATGVSWRHLALEGFERLLGKGLYTEPRGATRA